jgi:hypothetical protein
MNSISIEFGALAAPIKEQLKDQGISLEDDISERFEKIAYSIVFLHLQGIIPDSVRDSARKKLMKKISIAIHYEHDPAFIGKKEA